MVSRQPVPALPKSSGFRRKQAAISDAVDDPGIAVLADPAPMACMALPVLMTSSPSSRPLILVSPPRGRRT
jgi:hypothetical protein